MITEVTTSENIDALHRLTDGAKSIAVTAHEKPDGDAVGSTTALCSFLRDILGKEAAVVLPDAPPATLGFLAGRHEIISDPEEAIHTLETCDLLFCLDFNTPGRTGHLSEAIRNCKAPKILIDHHLNPESDLFSLIFSTPEVSSTCELLFSILMKMPEIAGKAEALPTECRYSLMTGMTTDTNNFANSVFPGTLQMASALLKAGVDRDDIILHLYQENSRERFSAWNWLLANKLRLTDYGVAYMVMTEEEKDRLNLEDGETEGLVNMPLQMKDIRISAFLKDYGDHFRISLRSKKGTVINTLAGESFHGGGHAQASGGKILIPEDLEDKTRIETYFEEIAARFVQNQATSKDNR